MTSRDSSTLPEVRLRDGICFPFSSEETVSADGSGTQHDLNILSHAHGDHLIKDGTNVDVVTSELTAELAEARREGVSLNPILDRRVTLIPSGHIAGSRAALVETRDGTVLYTGDIATRDRFYLDGFTPPSADVLIIEATYGDPAYKFPPTDQVIAEALEWLGQDMDRPVVLFGYTLGKAQKIQQLVLESARDRVFVSDAISEMNSIIESALNIEFPAEVFSEDTELDGGDALVLPSQTSGFRWVDRLIDSTNARTAGFSGWASDSGYIYRHGYDSGFVLSDHCDFSELLEVVDTVSPEQIYTHHGSSETLARELVRRGYTAQALQQDQTSLSEF